MRNKYRLLLLILLIVMSIFRIVISVNLGLSDDEAHYWRSSQDISLSYYDHPPVITYLVRISTELFGNTVFGIRMVAITCFFIMSLLLFLFTEEMYNTKTGFYTTLLFQIIPVFFFGSIIIIPNVILGIFWIAFMYIFYKLLVTGEIFNWYLLGILFGLALLVTYNAVFLVLSAIIFLLLLTEDKYHLKKRHMYISVLLGVVVFSPVIIWNYEYGFISFIYWFNQIFGQLTGRGPGIFLKDIVTQIYFISPLLFIACIYVVVKYLKEADKRTLFLLSFSLPTIVFFNVVGLSNGIWIGYIAILVLLTHKVISIESGMHSKMAFNIIKYSVLVCSVIFTMLISTQALYKKIMPLPRNIPGKAVITNEFYRWDKVSAPIQNILNTGDYFILTDKCHIADQLTFHMPSHPRVYCINSNTDHYDFLQQDLTSLNTKNAVFVTDSRSYVYPGDIYPFKKFEKQEPINIYNRNKVVRKFHLFICKYFMLDKVNSNMRKPPSQTNIIRTLKHYDELILLKTNNISGRSKLLDIAMVGFTMIGNGVVAIPLVGIILLFVNRKRFVKDFSIFVAIIITGGILIQILKSLYDQPRPLKVLTDIRILLSPLKERGFPSGHTYMIFSVAAYLTDKLKGILRNYIWVLYLVAIFGGLSRIYVGAHYLSDVIAGAVIGILFTLFCIYLLKIISLNKGTQF